MVSIYPHSYLCHSSFTHMAHAILCLLKKVFPKNRFKGDQYWHQSIAFKR